MGAAMATMVVLLTLAGPWFLELVYGPSISGSTYLFRDVLIGTGLIAILWYFFDVLVVCRDMRDAMLSAAVALGVGLVLMVPLEGAFSMSGINYTVILACLAGIAVGVVELRKTVRRAEDDR